MASIFQNLAQYFEKNVPKNPANVAVEAITTRKDWRLLIIDIDTVLLAKNVIYLIQINLYKKE